MKKTLEVTGVITEINKKNRITGKRIVLSNSQTRKVTASSGYRIGDRVEISSRNIMTKVTR